jgi:hypothetical protein
MWFYLPPILWIFFDNAWQGERQNTVFYLVQCTYEYSAHLNFTMIFWQKKNFLFFKNNFTRINHCKFIHHKSHLKPFPSYLPCTVWKEYFSIILNVKKCGLYSIKCSIGNKWKSLLSKCLSKSLWVYSQNISQTV